MLVCFGISRAELVCFISALRHDDGQSYLLGDWTSAWLVFAGYSLVVAVAFALLFKYKHTPENVALSYIYNQVKQESSDKDLLFLFDQDSIIDNEYFDKVTSAAENNNDIALFMPYVKHNEMFVSPGRFFLYKGKYLKELKLGRLCSKNIIGITSGMAIVPDKIKFKFDENLKLYGIDSKFCLDYSDNFKYIYIVEYNLKHSLSKFEKEDKAVKLFRLKSEMNAMRYVTKNRSFIGYLLCCMATYMHLIIFKIKNLL